MPLTGLPKATRVAISTNTIEAGEDWTDAGAIGARELVAFGALKERDVVDPTQDPTLNFMLEQSSFELLLESRL